MTRTSDGSDMVGCPQNPCERIVAAAIQRGGISWELPPPARHHNVIAIMPRDADGYYDRAGDVQGFVTSEGRFVDRRSAMFIAEAAHQLKRRDTPGSYQGPDLYSEDLW
jgi:hypothetical protein